MAIREHLEPLMAAISSTNLGRWNQWREQNSTLRPDLREANLSNADLRIANLSDANMSRSNLANANLAGANLNGTNLADAILCRADLSDADLRCAHLMRADLTGANLTGADMRFADLRGTNLTDAELSGARVNPSELKRAIRRGNNLIKSLAKVEASPIIDKGHFPDLENVGHSRASEDKPQYPFSVEEMIAKMQLTERRFEERKSQMQKEIAQTRMRLEGELLRRVEAERQKIVLPFLEVLDNLERALTSVAQSGSYQSLLQGVELIASQLRATLQLSGVEVVPALNRTFDPNLEQAVGVVSVTDPTQDGTVVEELQRGYRMGGQLLRPAQVRVGHLSVANTPLPRS